MTDLTAKEREALQLLRDGHQSKVAAHMLGIHTNTMKFRVRQAMSKLGAKTPLQATCNALEKGLIQ